MKIAILTELFHPHIAGCERRFFEIGKRLSRRRHEVHVFTMQYEKELPNEEVVCGIFIHRYAHSRSYIKKNGFRSLTGVLRYSLITALKVCGSYFDAYYSNQWPILHSVFAKPFTPVLIQEWCEVWFDKIVILEKMLKKITNHHVAVSGFTKHRLVNFLGIEPGEISVIPNGVDYYRFSEGSHEKKFGKIVYVGRIAPHKHVDMLIQIKRAIPEVELHIVGSGPFLSRIKAQATKLNDVYVYGALPDKYMLDILKESFICVLPSEREGSGIVALEAMAAGTPVITLDFPNNAAKELVNMANGIVVSPSTDSMVKAVSDLLNDEGRWCEMSKCARCFAKQYDWDIITTKMENYLREIVGEC